MREFDTHTPPSCSTHMYLKSAKYERLTPTQLWDLENRFFDETFSGNLLKSLSKFIGKWREMKVKIMRIFAALEDVELFLEMKIAKIVLDYEVRLWALYRIQFWSRLEKFWGFSELDFWIGSQHQMKPKPWFWYELRWDRSHRGATRCIACTTQIPNTRLHETVR